MRRAFLHVLIASVVLSAGMGIVALLSHRFGETEIKVLLSTLCVAGASILSMACAAALEKGRAPGVAVVGMGTAILGFLLLLVVIWGELEGKTYGKAAGTLLIAAGFCTHAALLLLAHPAAPRRWLQPVTLVATALLGLLLTVVMWDETRGTDVWRAIGILAILGTAGTILTAVFHRMGRDAARAAEGEAAGTAAGCCPHCGKPLPAGLHS